jgi:hypothetical protein
MLARDVPDGGPYLYLLKGTEQRRFRDRRRRGDGRFFFLKNKQKKGLFPLTKDRVGIIFA